MKVGYYYKDTSDYSRCFYFSGIKKGNRWIDIRSEGHTYRDTMWMSLMWMCLPKESELNNEGYVYSEKNPTKYIDPKNK
jgi:hypothetical protein